jgi:hypothetical protein
MWDGAKNPSSRRRTNSFTRRHAMTRNGIEGRRLKRGKAQTILRLGFQTQRKFRQEGGFFNRGPTQGGRWWLPLSSGRGESCESMFAHGLFVHQKCFNYAWTNLLFGLCRSV